MSKLYRIIAGHTDKTINLDNTNTITLEGRRIIFIHQQGQFDVLCSSDEEAKETYESIYEEWGS